MFEQASKQKLRFTTETGLHNVEDLWDSSLQSLDKLAKHLSKVVKETGEENFLEEVSSVDEVILLKFDIVKHIIKVKLKAAKDATLDTEKRIEKQKILGIMARKQDSELEDLSVEDLQKKLDNL